MKLAFGVDASLATRVERVQSLRNGGFAPEEMGEMFRELAVSIEADPFVEENLMRTGKILGWGITLSTPDPYLGMFAGAGKALKLAERLRNADTVAPDLLRSLADDLVAGRITPQEARTILKDNGLEAHDRMLLETTTAEAGLQPGFAEHLGRLEYLSQRAGDRATEAAAKVGADFDPDALVLGGRWEGATDQSV